MCITSDPMQYLSPPSSKVKDRGLSPNVLLVELAACVDGEADAILGSSIPRPLCQPHGTLHYANILNYDPTTNSYKIYINLKNDIKIKYIPI